MQEASLKPDLDVSSIEERMKIRTAVQSGDIETAIGLVNDLNPEVRSSFFFLRKEGGGE